MVAYFILVHRFPKQFMRMFGAIYDPKNLYLVHVDKKADPKLLEEVKSFLDDFPNSYVMKSQNVVWGGYSMVDVELKAIKELLDMDLGWKYFINLSGQDFPLKTPVQIFRFLKKFPNKNYMKVANQIKTRPNTLNRIENYFNETSTGFSGSPTKRRYLQNVIPYIGGQWKILTRECCRFMTSSPKVTKYKKYYENTLIPDESFFQTVLMNEGFADRIIDDDKRAIVWIPDLSSLSPFTKKTLQTTQELIESGEVKLRPKTYTEKDHGFLLKSDALFARKFDDLVDSSILNLLEVNLSTDSKQYHYESNYPQQQLYV